MDYSKLKRVFLSLDPRLESARGARDLLKSILSPRVASSFPGLEIKYDIRSDGSPSVFKAVLADGREITVPMNGVGRELAEGRVQSALKDAEFRELLKANKLDTHKFQDAWDRALGRPLKPAKGSIHIPKPIKSRVNPLKYWGKENNHADHDTKPSDLSK